MEETICLTCGDRGYTNTFVYCVKCLNFAVHRYCLDVMPRTYDEFLHWVCDDCEDKVKTQRPAHTCDYSTSKVKEENNCGSDPDCGPPDHPIVSADYPKDVDVLAAGPVETPIWRGCFSILNNKCDDLDGVVAHTSSAACMQVYEEASKFEPMLQFEMLPKSEIWPKSFQIIEPSESIALYFFPSRISERDFDILVQKMVEEKLGLKAVVQNAELLIFNSTELPLPYWRFQGKYYIWGVFKGKKKRPPQLAKISSTLAGGSPPSSASQA